MAQPGWEAHTVPQQMNGTWNQALEVVACVEAMKDTLPNSPIETCDVGTKMKVAQRHPRVYR